MQPLTEDEIKQAFWSACVRAVEAMDETALKAVLIATGSDLEWSKRQILQQLTERIK